MVNQIVTVSVTQTVAPLPNTLQQTGAFISQGGTTNAINSFTLLVQQSSLTGMLTAPLALSTLNWASGVVTATAAVAHGLTIGQIYYLTIAGVTPTGFNGTYPCTITTTTQFTYALGSSPGSVTTSGTWVPGTQTQLQQMNTTFFAQGTSAPVYVLELGVGSVNAGVASLTTWLTNNPQTVYALLVPREWDAVASFLNLLQSYNAATGLLYFWVTTTNATYTSYPATTKCVEATIEAPVGVRATTEFSAAAEFWQLLQTNPSPTNQVPPFSFRFLYGVTPYPTVGNGTLFANWQAAGVNWIGTGYEGGISTAIALWGTYMDGNPINYWYAADWVQININLNLSNAIINGSNDPQAPLYLNQQGINTLQAVAANTFASAITFGLLVGTVVQSELAGPAYTLALEQGQFAGQAVINAIPFVAYYTTNPGQYSLGTYNGFSATITPLRGFTSITFFINLSGFVAL